MCECVSVCLCYLSFQMINIAKRISFSLFKSIILYFYFCFHLLVLLNHLIILSKINSLKSNTFSKSFSANQIYYSYFFGFRSVLFCSILLQFNRNNFHMHICILWVYWGGGGDYKRFLFFKNKKITFTWNEIKIKKKRKLNCEENDLL